MSKPEPNPEGKKRISEPFYPVTWTQAQHDYRDGILTPRGLVYIYLRTHLRPGAETEIDVDKFCQALQIHESTYYRAVGALKGRGRINIRRGRMTVGLPEIPTLYGESQSCESESQMSESNSQSCESESQMSENRFSNPSPENPQGTASRSCAKTGNVPITDLKDLKEQNRNVPPAHPVGTAVNREEIGTDPSRDTDPLTAEIEDLCTQIQTAGIRPNKTIQETLYKLLLDTDSEQAAAAVRNAISAFREQEKRGTVRNAGGFLNAALRRSFTANEAKKQARVAAPPPAAQQPPAPSQSQIVSFVEQALYRGDRAIALSQLQAWWDAGYQDQVEEMCIAFKRDWQFIITAQGVRENGRAG